MDAIYKEWLGARARIRGLQAMEGADASILKGALTAYAAVLWDHVSRPRPGQVYAYKDQRYDLVRDVSLSHLTQHKDQWEPVVVYCIEGSNMVFYRALSDFMEKFKVCC